MQSWPSEPERCLFDKSEASSYKAASWAKHRVQGLEGAVLLQSAIDRAQQKASSARVVILGSPAKRYGQLAATQQIYNAKWESYVNSVGLSRELRKRRSLNIPRETIGLKKFEGVPR